jgi:2-polyprenyl-3-methyl-5-hydroxy-6-metoxy-1,4-benzoquinol methylase
MSTDQHAEEACLTRWTALLAPRTGNLRAELTIELSEYLRRPMGVIEAHLADATARFTEEWRARIVDPADERAVARFYNESKTEVFDLARWHADDPIHVRTLMCAEIASRRPGRAFLDYGSGVGSDALVFAAAGFDVTLADIADPLLAFAKWRCERHGVPVRTVDLKRERLPRQRFDAVVCFDVLEHIHRPLRPLNAIRRAMTPGALFFMHAPFGSDPDRPMHVVHADVVTPRMRSVGFTWRGDLEHEFPQWLWHPRVYEAFDVSPIDRLGYRLHDVWWHGPTSDYLARLYRRVRPRRVPRPVDDAARELT